MAATSPSLGLERVPPGLGSGEILRQHGPGDAPRHLRRGAELQDEALCYKTCPSTSTASNISVSYTHLTLPTKA